MKKCLVLSLLLLILAGSLGFAGDDTVVARIGDKKITMDDFNRITGYYDAEKRKILAENPVFKATILQRLVQGMVISTVAREKGFDKRSDIKEQLDLLNNDFLAAEYIKKEIIDKITVSEDDMRLFYQSHQDEFRTPEMVRARQILVKVDKEATEETKKKAKERATDLLKRIREGEDFAQVASQSSEDSGSKANGGDLGYFDRGKMAPEFEKVVFSLKPGEVSDVFETTSGFHVVKVEDKREAALEPYEKVKEKIREKLIADLRKGRIDEFAEKAMKDAGVELNLEPFLPKQ